MLYESLVIVGSSGSGKTTAVNAVRGLEFADYIHIPKRHITRPHRLGDDIVENSHVTHEVFETAVSEGEIYPHWFRDLGGDSLERYGFDTPIEEDSRLRIYSANNAFVRNQNSTTEAVLRNSLVVLIWATREERESRLFGRSPDITNAERIKRLTDNADDIYCMPGVEVINTTRLTPEQATDEFMNLVSEVVFPSR